MSTRTTFLPYGRQSIDEDDITAVATALRGELLTTGPLVERFEARFAEAVGASHAVACNSGTAALHLAALALELGPGDAAIVPSLTFLATANAVRMTGAEVVFADVDCDTGLLTPAALEDALGRAKAAGLSVAAALPVHLNGQVCDMAELGAIARDNGIALIEDACHALGVADVGATAHSRMACFSTHPVKAIATGEGGVLTTADEALARRAREFRNHGLIRDPQRFENRELAFDSNGPNPWYYEMQEIGWNYRLPDVLCALGLSQLEKLDRFYRRRCEIAAMYDRLLEPLAPTLRPARHNSVQHGWHLYAILVDFDRFGMTRGQVMAALRMKGIGTQVHYIPLHHQPYYRERYGAQELRGADTYYARCLSLPLYPAASGDDVHRVADTLIDLFGARRRPS